MSFKINPCKAVLEKGATNINTMNNICYETSSAYGRVYGPEVQKDLDSRCADMIVAKKNSMGKTPCSLRRPPPPPIFNQTPHFFPELLHKLNDPALAYQKCCEMSQSSSFPNTALENCRLDASAITNSNVENFVNRDNMDHRRHKRSIDYQKYAKAHPWEFFIGFASVIILILFFVYLFVKALGKRK